MELYIGNLHGRLTSNKDIGSVIFARFQLHDEIISKQTLDSKMFEIRHVNQFFTD